MLIQFPLLSISDLRRRVSAYETLFGFPPDISVSGLLRCDDGSLCFCSEGFFSAQLKGSSSKYLLLFVDGRWVAAQAVDDVLVRFAMPSEPGLRSTLPASRYASTVLA